MKASIKLSVLLLTLLSIVGCETLDSSAKSSANESSDNPSSSGFTYSFQNKEQGITLDEVTAIANNLPAQENKKVRYTWHIVERITGNYPNTMLDGKEMPEGEIIGDFVSEPRNNNSDTFIQLISGTPVTRMQKYYARNYTSDVTPKGWLSYHELRRGFLKYAQEGEGFEERFYTGPLTLWMRIWGRRPSNAQMDGTYFSYEEFERVYNAEGYCTSLMIKEYTYMQGTLSGGNSNPRYFDGSYEYTVNCSIEYLD